MPTADTYWRLTMPLSPSSPDFHTETCGEIRLLVAGGDINPGFDCARGDDQTPTIPQSFRPCSPPDLDPRNRPGYTVCVPRGRLAQLVRAPR
jgi:hypothetical protein